MQFEYAATVEHDLAPAELHPIRAGFVETGLDPLALEFHQLQPELALRS